MRIQRIETHNREYGIKISDQERAQLAEEWHAYSTVYGTAAEARNGLSKTLALIESLGAFE